MSSPSAHPGVPWTAGRIVLGVLGTLLTVAVLTRFLDLGQIRVAFENATAGPGVVVLVAIAYTAAFWVRALAWRELLSTPAGLGTLFSILQVSLFLNHVLPFRAGEVSRPVLAARHGVPLTEAAATTVVARLMDFAALAAIALIAIPALGSSRELSTAFYVAAASLILVSVALVALRQGLALPVPGRLRAHIEAVRVPLRAMSLRRITAAAPLVAASWILESAVLVGAAWLLEIDLSVQAAVGATAFAILFQIVHVTPGGLGIYEASMTSVLVFEGVPAEDALALAVVTHGLKFAYSLTMGLGFAAWEASLIARDNTTNKTPHASRFEIVAARLWNVINEGKPFTPVFTLGILALLSLPQLTDGEYWQRAPLALLALAPMLLVFWRFDFPLRLRGALWVALLAFLLLFRAFEVGAVLVVLGAYLSFTVGLWGTVYYHLRIGTPWTNFLRFWRLVLENPDPTSGNLLEQVPKILLLVFAFQYLVDGFFWQPVVSIELFALCLGITALLLHQWFFTWVPALPQPGLRRDEIAPVRKSQRVIAIVIDGCRADRLHEAHTPFIDQLRAEGTEFTHVSTVYPARTVTCFSSMLTGAAPKTHGMHSNFVPSLGVKCESVFDVLRREGMSAKLVGIAHLVDAFGEKDVRTVTAVMDNDEIDFALVDQARQVLRDEDPELLVLQLLSVDQTGHARGSYHDEYLRKIEATDRIIEEFIGWCETGGYLDDATLLITADHGQGIGIGGHGHMSPSEVIIPCLLWGTGVEPGLSIAEPRFITDIAPTLCGLLGVPSPAESIGRALAPYRPRTGSERVAFVIPAHNEEKNLPRVLAALSQIQVAHEVVVVDDGSADGTAEIAAAHGAMVVRHDRNRGLGAALRTGLAAARDLDVTAAVYLDADGEYDPRDAELLLTPIREGRADYVLGSRFKGTIEGMTLSRRVANRAFSVLLSALCGRWISDGQTGYRAFSRRALDVAEIVHDYNYAQVLTLDLLHKGMRMTEVPVRYQRREHGRSFIKAQYLWRVPAGIAREMLGG